MFKKIKEFFTGKPAVVETPVESAPYKVPEPAATTPIPLVVAAPAPVVEATPAKAKKAPAAKKAPTKKAPAVKKPRAPKAK